MTSPLHEFFQTTLAAAASIESSSLTVSIVQDNSIGHPDPFSIAQRPSFRRQVSYCKEHRRRKELKKQRNKGHLKQVQALEKMRCRWSSDPQAAKQVESRQEDVTCNHCGECQSAPKIPRRRQSINVVPRSSIPKKPCRRDSGDISELCSVDALIMLSLNADAA